MLIDEVIRIAEPFRNKTIIVGLSGGADSVCLVHALKNAGFDVASAHVNHCLRGDESDGDEVFVKGFCKKNHIPLYVKRVDVSAVSKELGCGLEDAGRRTRYAFFETLIDKNGIIATAHNKNDAAETVLLNLIRGSGGLRGIPVREDCLRPLINVSRAEIEEYCRENSLEYRTDSSNLKDDYTRNKIRLSIIPELKKINPMVEDAILRAEEINKLDRQIAESAAENIKVEEVSGRWFVSSADIDTGVLYRVIRRLYAKECGNDKNLSFENVRAAAELARSGKTGKIAELGCGVCLETVYGGFLVGRLPEKVSFDVKLDGKTVIPEAGIVITVSHDDVPSGKVSFDADKVGAITARSRKNGDRMRLGGFTKKLKNIMIDKKIPANRRDRMAVLEHEGGILGVIGIGFDRNFTASDKTVKFLNLDWTEYNR